MKRRAIFLCSLAICLSFTGCTGTSSTTSTTSASESTSSTSDVDYSNQTITGKVTAIDDTSVTLQLGKLTDNKPENSSDSQQTPPEKPNGDSSDGSSNENQTPPDKPDSDSSDSSSDENQTPPDKPDSDSSDGSSNKNQTPPDKPDDDSQMGGAPDSQTFTAGDTSDSFDLSDVTIQKEEKDSTTEASIDDISVDSILSITFGDDNTITSVTIISAVSGNGAPGNGTFGGSGEVTQGTAATTLDSDATISDESYTSTGDDENALRIDDATVTLNGITVDKSAGSSSNTEDGDFYGMNAALLATNGANVTISGADIQSSAQNGNGVFSYGEGTTVNISDSTITTSADNSGGIQTTGGGTTNATNLTVETSGNSAAAIRSDRGGGTVNVEQGTYTSNGYNSPAVYSTADISVSGATLTANNSEALVIEGSNSIALTNCDVTGNMSDTKGSSSDENVHNVMIYQSMSGDAEVGTSSFSMTGGSLTAKNGDMFYITNTHCVLSLSGVSITNEDADANLMTITGNSASHGWGSAGSNGAQAEITAQNQVLEGKIVVDSISTLNLTLSDKSTFTGTINITDNTEGGTAVSDNAVVTIDEGCTWTLSGDCTISSLSNNGTIDYNGYTITLADGTVLSE